MGRKLPLVLWSNSDYIGSGSREFAEGAKIRDHTSSVDLSVLVSYLPRDEKERTLYLKNKVFRK